MLYQLTKGIVIFAVLVSCQVACSQYALVAEIKKMEVSTK